ncbi:aliphatic sulfonates import ATP-binding protein SsuB 1 [Alicyclobacillus cellulosilyticus]|uniref:Aliphatic sulfonates import ATP-binding protein SsuB 1 n=1 Tax=Alicyclobacillus cellulosilyticus TaxID=1003997 RepID=A0A917KD32_9BACL|nr:aliphatic sulfonates import ATP-binding protein SsuB 1 [Alicyclobacillus cellulosilyticus]
MTDAAAQAKQTAERPGVPIALAGVWKSFDGHPVIQGLNLAAQPGEFLAIVGRSGCGKSTLLRLMAGLAQPDAGKVEVAWRTGARDGGVRMMFQDARLLPWKRVIDNVRLGARGEDADEAARAALAQVGLLEKARAWPHTLSGGQRQRVALARALASRPRLLLLDEPLGALDALTRLEMQRLVEDVWRAHGFTAVLVTHDVAEAIALADRIVLMAGGTIAGEWTVRLPRPRPRDAAFYHLEQEILSAIMDGTAAGGHRAV